MGMTAPDAGSGGRDDVYPPQLVPDGSPARDDAGRADADDRHAALDSTHGMTAHDATASHLPPGWRSAEEEDWGDPYAEARRRSRILWGAVSYTHLRAH